MPSVPNCPLIACNCGALNAPILTISSDAICSLTSNLTCPVVSPPICPLSNAFNCAPRSALTCSLNRIESWLAASILNFSSPKVTN